MALQMKKKKKTQMNANERKCFKGYVGMSVVNRIVSIAVDHADVR